MMRSILGVFFLLIFSASAVKAQSMEETEPGGANVLYRKEKLGGVLAHSHGLGLWYRNGTHMTGTLKRFLEVELVNMKHSKEIKTSSRDNISRSFIYGKLNSVYMLRAGVGLQRKLHGKDDGRGVEVRGHLFAGPSIALAKPYYLQVRDNSLDQTVVRRYDPQQHHMHNIIGRAGFLNGIPETKPYPGVYLKSGLAFEYSGDFDTVKGLECGIVVDGFLKEVPIMAFTNNHQIFVSLYLGLFIGRKSV